MLKQKIVKCILGLSLFLIAILPVNAQDTGSMKVKDYPGARPDIPGMLGLEFGWVLAPDLPEAMKLNFIGSVYLSPYYKYEIRIPNSNFSFHPGIAIASEKYSFDNNITLISTPTPSGYMTDIVGLDSLFADASIKKSKLNAVYLEIPLEISFRTNRELPKRSFRFTVGARGGIRLDAKTKYTYRQDGQTKKSKQKENFDLNTWRVVLVGRIGYGSVNLFYNYSMLPLFMKDRGPLGTEAQSMNLGISFDLF